MKCVKERMIKIIESQPPDSTWEEIMRALTFEKMVERGIEDSEAGRLISHKEMRRKIESWLK